MVLEGLGGIQAEGNFCILQVGGFGRIEAVGTSVFSEEYKVLEDLGGLAMDPREIGSGVRVKGNYDIEKKLLEI